MSQLSLVPLHCLGCWFSGRKPDVGSQKPIYPVCPNIIDQGKQLKAVLAKWAQSCKKSDIVKGKKDKSHYNCIFSHILLLKINWGISRNIRKQTRQQEPRSFPIFLRLPNSDIADTEFPTR